jgi:FixJ family two-component response regulator
MAECSDLRIDLMLVDVGMPEVARPDFPERILASSTDLKVLFMSDGAPDSEMVRIKTLYRALDFLQKPFEIGTLLERVNRALTYPSGALGSDDPDEGGTPDDGCAGVVSPLLPRLP